MSTANSTENHGWDHVLRNITSSWLKHQLIKWSESFILRWQDTEGTITFEDTNGRQYNDQKNKNKGPNNYQQKTYRKQRLWARTLKCLIDLICARSDSSSCTTISTPRYVIRMVQILWLVTKEERMVEYWLWQTYQIRDHL